MTNYTQTVSKRKGGMKTGGPQTGLIPALPAVGSAATSLLSGAGIATGAASLGSKLKNALNLGNLGKAASGAQKAGGAAVGAGKVAGTGIVLNEFSKFMDIGPEVGGVNILPLAAVGGAGLLGLNMFMGDGASMGAILPIAGAGILVGGYMLSQGQ